MSKPNTGARFEIAIDGTTRTHRDSKELAIETATRHWRPRHPATIKGAPRLQTSAERSKRSTSDSDGVL